MQLYGKKALPRQPVCVSWILDSPVSKSEPCFSALVYGISQADGVAGVLCSHGAGAPLSVGELYMTLAQSCTWELVRHCCLARPQSSTRKHEMLASHSFCLHVN